MLFCAPENSSAIRSPRRSPTTPPTSHAPPKANASISRTIATSPSHAAGAIVCQMPWSTAPENAT
jgi:hypothetical protein